MHMFTTKQLCNATKSTITPANKNTKVKMIDQQDRDNVVALIIKAANGSLDEWLDTLSDDELEYALKLLKAYNASREKFINSL